MQEEIKVTDWSDELKQKCPDVYWTIPYLSSDPDGKTLEKRQKGFTSIKEKWYPQLKSKILYNETGYHASGSEEDLKSDAEVLGITKEEIDEMGFSEEKLAEGNGHNEVIMTEVLKNCIANKLNDEMISFQTE